MTAADTAIAAMNDTQNSESWTVKTWPRNASSTSIWMAESAHSLTTWPAAPTRNPHTTITGSCSPAPPSWKIAASPSAPLAVANRPHRPTAAGVTNVATKAPRPVAARNTTTVPSPATSCIPECLTSTSTSNVLMPNTTRWAASPDSVAATVGTDSTVRMPYPQPVATA